MHGNLFWRKKNIKNFKKLNNNYTTNIYNFQPLVSQNNKCITILKKVNDSEIFLVVNLKRVEE